MKTRDRTILTILVTLLLLAVAAQLLKATAAVPPGVTVFEVLAGPPGDGEGFGIQITQSTPGPTPGPTPGATPEAVEKSSPPVPSIIRTRPAPGVLCFILATNVDGVYTEFPAMQCILSDM